MTDETDETNETSMPSSKARARRFDFVDSKADATLESETRRRRRRPRPRPRRTSRMVGERRARGWRRSDACDGQCRTSGRSGIRQIPARVGYGGRGYIPHRGNFYRLSFVYPFSWLRPLNYNNRDQKKGYTGTIFRAWLNLMTK